MALDVYKDWLGIPDGPRPPDHYTLLRLVQFEDNIEKIRGNYRKLNGHVRKYASGQYSVPSQELLNELAKAMLCLTDPERKREYDESQGREFAEELTRTGTRLTENVLVEQGVITNAKKRVHSGRMDIGEIMGTPRLFDWAHGNRAINMEPSDTLHDPQVVAALGAFVSVNSALEVDLLGQVNAESVDGRQMAGIGGQFDFVLGASRAPGGRSIIALPSTTPDGKQSRIVASLESRPVTTTRADVDIVVTEYGVADLRGRSFGERTEHMRAIAHPDFRDRLQVED